MTTKAKMSDKRLFALAIKQKKAKLAEADAKAEAQALSDKIIPEMKRRGVKALESEEVRVNKVAGEQTTYDLDDMEEALSPALFKKLTKRVPDTDAIAEALSSGRLKQTDLRKFATTVPKSEYIVVTFK